MKKIIKLNESDLKNIIEKIILEQGKAKKYNILSTKKETPKTDVNKIKSTDKDLEKIEKNSSKNKSVDTHNEKEYAVFVPKDYSGKEAHVLFGGMHSYQNGKVNLYDALKMAIEPIKGKVIVVVTHWNNNLDKVRKYVKDKYGAEVTSIAGFSKGGIETWKHVGNRSNLKFVGLIDPSTREIDVDFGSNTYMIADWQNWGNAGLRSNLKWYCDRREDPKYKGKISCTDTKKYDHVPILYDFYKKFANKI